MVEAGSLDVLAIYTCGCRARAWPPQESKNPVTWNRQSEGAEDNCLSSRRCTSAISRHKPRGPRAAGCRNSVAATVRRPDAAATSSPPLRPVPGRYGSRSDGGERTSIDGDHRAGHVTGSRGEQEGCHASEFLRGPAPAKRVQRLVVASRAQLDGARGGNSCGHESVDSDPTWAELIGQPLGNHAEPGAKAIWISPSRGGALGPM